MLKKRLIGVVTLKNGRAVQSIGYKRWLPLGSAECLVENLDRWGADEILVLSIDRTKQCLGPDFKLIERLGALGLCTPISYGGGIRSTEDAIQVVHAGADRIVIDGMLHHNPQILHGLAQKLGAQAVIAALPLSIKDDNLLWLDYARNEEVPLTGNTLDLIAGRNVSELLVIDWRNEGQVGNFDMRLLDKFPESLTHLPRIAFGGIGIQTQCKSLLQRNDICGVALGNLLSYREHALQACKEHLQSEILRVPEYECTETSQ